jgi:hypothetical protein
MLVRHLPYTIAFNNGNLRYMFYGEICERVLVLKTRARERDTHTHTHNLVWFEGFRKESSNSMKYQMKFLGGFSVCRNGFAI